MIKYNTIVEVLSGFYEGTRAHVIKEDSVVTSRDAEGVCTYRYEYKLITSWGHETEWLKEDILKPIIGSQPYKPGNLDTKGPAIEYG